MGLSAFLEGFEMFKVSYLYLWCWLLMDKDMEVAGCIY